MCVCVCVCVYVCNCHLFFELSPGSCTTHSSGMSSKHGRWFWKIERRINLNHHVSNREKCQA